MNKLLSTNTEVASGFRKIARGQSNILQVRIRTEVRQFNTSALAYQAYNPFTANIALWDDM